MSMDMTIAPSAYGVVSPLDFATLMKHRLCRVSGGTFVYMKGSKIGISANYSEVEWKSRLIERFLRRTKFTEFSLAKIENRIRELVNATNPSSWSVRSGIYCNLSCDRYGAPMDRVFYYRGIRAYKLSL